MTVSFIMEEIWSEKRVYDYLVSHGHPIPANAYCTRNFAWRELLIRQVELPGLTILKNLSAVARLLQQYRNTIFRCSPVTITSGWRSIAYNKKIGGSTNSYHIIGLAVDFVVENFTPLQVQNMLDPVHKGGLEFAPSWTHVDLRKESIRFDQKGRIIKKISPK